jgi:hypothetical protein
MGIWMWICFWFVTLGIKHLVVDTTYPFTSSGG